ncbi:MAG: hypothetical protein ACREQN_13005 [Candidatus Binataceae bacterium]
MSFGITGVMANLKVPLLTENIQMDRHVLTLYLNLNRKQADLDHPTDIYTERKSQLVAIARVPIHHKFGDVPIPHPLPGKYTEKY